jgi:hypothetical protein
MKNVDCFRFNSDSWLSASWPIHFITYISDLRISTLSESQIVADVISVIISFDNVDDSVLCDTQFCLIWQNGLVLRCWLQICIKIIEFISSSSLLYNKYVGEAVNTEVVGLQINSHLNWKYHIDQIYKLFWAWCMVNSVFHIGHISAVKIP